MLLIIVKSWLDYISQIQQKIKSALIFDAIFLLNRLKNFESCQQPQFWNPNQGPVSLLKKHWSTLNPPSISFAKLKSPLMMVRKSSRWWLLYHGHTTSSCFCFCDQAAMVQLAQRLATQVAGNEPQGGLALLASDSTSSTILLLLPQSTFVTS